MQHCPTALHPLPCICHVHVRLARSYVQARWAVKYGCKVVVVLNKRHVNDPPFTSAFASHADAEGPLFSEEEREALFGGGRALQHFVDSGEGGDEGGRGGGGDHVTRRAIGVAPGGYGSREGVVWRMARTNIYIIRIVVGPGGGWGRGTRGVRAMGGGG